MSTKPSESAHADLSQDVEEALRCFWRGSFSEFDKLVDDGDPAEPGPCNLLAGLLNSSTAPPDLPSQIGDYTIVRTLGTGGMSVVYEARQHRTGQAVALKVMRRWDPTGAGQLKLFRREVQTLARLKHPYIAAMYDAGQTSEGQHYFAMELVQGESLHKFMEASHRADDCRVGPGRQRLEMFCKICRAMSYAHQRGVIHRDLKPGNIVITETGEPKILDFGLARLLETDVSLVTTVSEANRIVGTLAYMSPEQARGQSDEIDTRTDVYSLGVMLYELVTGIRPYEARSTALPEAVHNICEVEPKRPGVLNRILRGDLEAIILKALEKEPARRYQSAAELADDIDRFLSDQPVTARVPSALYQIQKLIIRHKIPAALSAALFLLACTFAVVAMVQKGRIRAERDHAQLQARRAAQISDYLTDMLSSLDPTRLRTQLRLRDVLDRAAAGLDSELANDSETAASLHDTLGRSYLNLHLPSPAQQHLEKAYTLRRALFGNRHALTLTSLDQLGRLAATQGKHADAEHILMDVISARRELLGQEHADVADSLNDLGDLYEKVGDYPKAEDYYRQCIAMRQRLLGEHRDTVEAQYRLGAMLVDAGRSEDGERVLNEVLSAQRRLFGPDHHELARPLTDLGEAYWNLGRYDDAEKVHREQIRIFRVSGEDSHDLAAAMDDLANVLTEKGQLTEAEQLFLQALEMIRRVSGTGHPDTALCMNDYGKFLVRQGRYKEAEPLAREVYKHWYVGSNNRQNARAYACRNLAAVLAGLGQFEEADKLYVTAIDIFREVFGTRNPALMYALSGRVELLELKGELVLAETLAREALQIADERLGKSDARTGARMIELAIIHQMQKNKDAELLAQEGYDVMHAKMRDHHPDFSWTLERLGWMRQMEGDFDGAQSFYRRAIDLERSLPRERHPILGHALAGLGSILCKLGNSADAESMLKEAVSIMRERHGPEDPRTRISQKQLAECTGKVRRLTSDEGKSN